MTEAESPSTRQQPPTSSPAIKVIVVSVIGNISSGKSTLTRGIADDPESNFHSVEEPVKKWLDTGLLDHFYNRTTPNMPYIFQQHAFIDRIVAFRETYFGLLAKSIPTLIDPNRPNTLIELVTDSHVVVDRWVFASHLNDTGDIPDKLMNLYVDTFDNWVSLLPCYRPQIVLYLKTTPNACLQRKYDRGRTEENGVGIQYLQSLHEKFESIAKDPSHHFGKDCNFVILDADQPEDVVLQRAIEAISQS